MKDKNTAAILALFLGGVGGHKFYLGQAGAGVVYALFCWTFIPAFIAFIEFLILLTMSPEAFAAKYNQQLGPGYMGVLPSQNIVVNVAPPQQQGLLAAGSGGSSRDVAAQIKELHELKLAGALTDEEFTEQKRKLLSAN